MQKQKMERDTYFYAALDLVCNRLSHNIYFLLLNQPPNDSDLCFLCVLHMFGSLQPVCSWYKQLVNDRGSNDAVYYFPKA